MGFSAFPCPVYTTHIVYQVSWFLAPTVALCEQQHNVIKCALPVSVGLISGALEPDQWKDHQLWRQVLSTHRIVVSTPQVLLDAMRHGHVNLGRDIGLLIFDEAHHAADNHPYNLIMSEFYFRLPVRPDSQQRPYILGLTASPIFGGNVARAFEFVLGCSSQKIDFPIDLPFIQNLRGKS
jgi:endoribonuclease Dicer